METPHPDQIHPVPRLASLCLTGFLAGTLLASRAGSTLQSLWLLSLLLSASALMLIHSDRKNGLAPLLCSLALILLTVWRAADPIVTHERNEEWMARHLVPLDGSIMLSGEIVKSGRTRSGNRWIQLTGGLASTGGSWTHYSGEIRVYGQKRWIGATGDRVVIEVTSIRQGRRSYPNGFDPGAWRVQEGFHGSASLVQVWLHVDRRLSGFGWVREQAVAIREQLQSIPMKIAHKGVLVALLTGDKSGLSPETEERMRRAGLSHMMAVSGLHVGLVTAPFWWLFLRIRHRWYAIPFWVATGAFLLLYVEIAQQSPSVVRAASMSWIGGCLLVPMRHWPTSRLLLLVGLGALFWNPIWLRHPGFQLSMAAVWSIVTIHAPLQTCIRNRIPWRWIRTLISTFGLTMTVQVALSPLLVWWFGEISMVAPLSNLLIAPLIPVVTLSGWGTGLLSGWIRPPDALLWIVSVLIEWIESVALFASSVPGATVRPEWSMFGLLLPPMIWSIRFRYHWLGSSLERARVWVWMSLIMFVLCLLRLEQRNSLVVTVLDVGQGDAIHMEMPNGVHLWIDTGTDDATERVVLPYIRDQGIERIDLLVLTHHHRDHMGGLNRLSRDVEIGNIWIPNESEMVIEPINGSVSNLNIQRAARGTWLTPDPRVRVYLLWSDPSHRSINDRSLVIKVHYGGTSMLFPGDIEMQQELSLTRTYGTWLKSDLLKAGHHGSRTSSHPFFLERVDPDWILISSGWRNRYDHPHRESIRRYHTLGATIRVTARSGSLRVRSDGVQIREML